MPHTIELLQYKDVADSLGWHTDEESALTTLVMLSEPSEYRGGELQHNGLRGSLRAHLARGDVAIYRGSQPHRVTPLRSGRRSVLVIEWWHRRDMDFSRHTYIHVQQSTGESSVVRTLSRRMA
jgi:predicted 2-oxoglutarate/Fe(II)-dependent dioxygenase YbiX